MRAFSTAVVLVILHISSLVAQQPNAETFTAFRASIIAQALPRIPPLKENLAHLFGMPDGIRGLTASEMVFPDHRRLVMTILVDSTDLLLSESRNTASGQIVTVFHTDSTLTLQTAASGPTSNDLQIVSLNDELRSQFQDVLMVFDGALKRVLQRRQGTL